MLELRPIPYFRIIKHMHLYLHRLVTAQTKLHHPLLHSRAITVYKPVCIGEEVHDPICGLDAGWSEVGELGGGLVPDIP